MKKILLGFSLLVILASSAFTFPINGTKGVGFGWISNDLNPKIVQPYFGWKNYVWRPSLSFSLVKDSVWTRAYGVGMMFSKPISQNSSNFYFDVGINYNSVTRDRFSTSAISLPIGFSFEHFFSTHFGIRGFVVGSALTIHNSEVVSAGLPLDHVGAMLLVQ